MIRKKYIGIVGLALTIFASCNNDDDNQLPTITPPRDVATQTASDDERLVEFLKTHFYNYKDFENGESTTIVFDTIPEGDTETVSLFKQIGEQVTATTITFAGIDHKIYVLKAREGAGETLSFADSVFVNYKGIALSEVTSKVDSTQTVFQLGSTFDSSSTPVWFNPNGTIPGFMMGFNGFKAASSVQLGEDGLLEPQSAYGIGAVFIPSFLAYYNSPPVGIEQYQSLIFTFDLISGKVLDHDNDGTPSKEEDANQNLILTDDDADGDGTPDFLDEDTK